MSKITAAENIENIKRTIAATTINIAAKTAELADLQAVNRLNIIELRKAEQAEAALNTERARWMRATKAIRKDGIKFLANVQACCRGCIGSEKLGMDEDSEQAYGYTYGGQGNRISWDEHTGLAVQKQDRWNRSSSVTAYINHGNGSAERIAAAFRAEGFEVTWNGSEAACVEVKFH